MIEQIENFTFKSFKNYSTPSNFFRKKNIIFGYNGRGKSSLSEGIIGARKGKNKNVDSYRFFNRDYVKKNLLLDESDSIIKGIKVSFSDKDADIADKIKKIKKNIVDTSTLEEQVSQKRDELRKKIDDIHDKKKNKARINRKPSRYSIEEVIEQYNEDLKEALKVNSSLDFIKNFYADSEKLEIEKNTIESLPLPDLCIEKISTLDQKFLIETLEKEYVSTEEIPTSDVIKWLEDGMRIHQESDSNCKFCHNSFTLEDVKTRIFEYRQNSEQQDISHLEQIKETLGNNLEIIEQAKKLKNNLPFIGISNDKIEELFDFDYIGNIENLIKRINEKINNMSKSISIENNILEFEEEMEKKFSIIVDAHKEKIKDIELAIRNIEKITKGTVAIAIKESDISEELKKITDDEDSILIIKKNNNRMEKEISRLEESQSEYEDFMKFLNEVLSSLGIQIRLTLENDNYYLKHTIEDINLSIDNISEGEKNLLALLYFYFEMYTDNKQEKIKEEIDLIVIDDPISSLDDSNKFYVLEILKKILSETNIQLFILTHSWDDFCQLTYGIKTTDGKYGFFEIYKARDREFSSQIRTCQSNVSPYKKLFSEVYLLKDKKDENLNECDIYHAANSMRRVFEEFLNFKKPNLLPQKSNQIQIEEIYRNATNEKLGNNRKHKLGSLLSFINVLSHRPVKSGEIIENSKTLMRLIEDIDKVHFDEMKKSVVE